MQLLLLSITRSFSKNKLYAFSGIISIFFNVLISIISIKILGGSVEVMFYGIISGYAVQSLYLMKKLKIFAFLNFDNIKYEEIKEIIRFCIPLSFNSVLHWMLEGFNKLVMTDKMGVAINGVYAVANKFSLMINLILNVFMLAWQEMVFKINDKEDLSNYYNDIGNRLIDFVGFLIILILPIFKFIFPFMIGKAYNTAFYIIPILIFSIYLNSINSFIVTLFSVVKKTIYATISKFVMVIINILIMFLLIDKFGIYASPIALSTSYLVGLFIQLKFANLFINFKFNYKGLILIIMIFMLSFFIYAETNLLMNFIWLCIIILVFLKKNYDFLIVLFYKLMKRGDKDA